MWSQDPTPTLYFSTGRNLSTWYTLTGPQVLQNSTLIGQLVPRSQGKVWVHTTFNQLLWSCGMAPMWLSAIWLGIQGVNYILKSKLLVTYQTLGILQAHNWSFEGDNRIQALHHTHTTKGYNLSTMASAAGRNSMTYTWHHCLIAWLELTEHMATACMQ